MTPQHPDTSTLEFIDTHAHLTDKQFAKDVEEIVARAQDTGITRIVTLGTDVESSRAAIDLAEKFSIVYAAVGIHPESVRESSIDDVEKFRELAAHDKVIAIGEIGLDYYWDKASVELQQEFFERQLQLAAELDLPVSIHDREAHEKMIETLESRKSLGVRGVLHSFSGDVAMANAALALGFYISFAGAVTFLNARNLHEIVRAIPLEKMLIETDSPYLSPHPLRGKRNEPANVKLVAERIAVLKGLSTEQVESQTTSNARALFGF